MPRPELSNNRKELRGILERLPELTESAQKSLLSHADQLKNNLVVRIKQVKQVNSHSTMTNCCRQSLDDDDWK